MTPHSLLSSLDNVASIDGYGLDFVRLITSSIFEFTYLAVQILTADAKQDSRRYVRFLSGSRTRQSFFVLFWHLTLLILSTVLGGHFGREYAWRDAVDSDFKSSLRNLR